MARTDAVDEAALRGLVGVVLIAVGTLVASFFLRTLAFWFAVVPALLVWGVFAYFGLKQFARGIYMIVEDAHS